MKRILFVDDERDLLQGLRDALRRRRKEWDMVFVTSGQEALQVLQDQAFDLIVTDMRMPGMDGAELLAAVCQRYPGMSRVVLTGHAERDQMTRASVLAQQILSKPCDGATLQQTLHRVLAARDHAGSERVRQLVGKVTDLPSVQWVYRDLVAAARSPACRIDDFAALLENDPALTARVLHLANAACFGDHARLHSVLAAIRFLGLAQVTALVLLARTFAMIERLPQARGFDVARWQAQSLLCASLARALCDDAEAADDAYVGGLLHDIGQVVFMVGCPEEHAQALRRIGDESIPARQAEKEAMGASHDEVGAHLLDCWGLAEAVVAAVARHHEQPAAPTQGRADAPTDTVVRAVWAALSIADDIDELPGDADLRLAWLRQRPHLTAAKPAALDRLQAVLARHAAGQPPDPAAPAAAPPAQEPCHDNAVG